MERSIDLTKLDSPKKAQMIGALAQHLGNVTKACEAVGVARPTHYVWKDKDEAYRQALNDINEAIIDHVESKLFQKIGDLDTTCIIFFLKTRAKHRGYIERQQHEHTGELKGITIEIVK